MRHDSNSVFEAHIRDLVLRAQKSCIPVYTDFLSYNEQLIAERIVKEFSTSFKFFGGYPDAENAILCIYCTCEPENNDFPINCLRIVTNNKRASLTHRDYMGAIMSLGIERSVFGDIIIKQSEAFCFVQQRISDFFIDNLESVGREKCNISLVQRDFNIETVNRFSEFNAIISSDRLDCFVAVICSLSRGSSVELIKKGLVSVNGLIITDQSKRILENDRIVIRGYGKYIIGPCDGKTRKDRLKIIIKKYN